MDKKRTTKAKAKLVPGQKAKGRRKATVGVQKGKRTIFTTKANAKRVLTKKQLNKKKK